MNEFIRNCPACQKILVYSNKYILAQAEHNNSKCLSCAKTKYTTVRTYVRNCPGCNCEIKYSRLNSLTNANIKNTKCIDCRTKERGKISNEERTRRHQEYYSKNKDAIKLRTRPYEIANRERKRIYAKQYRLNNAEKIKSKQSKYYKSNAAGWLRRRASDIEFRLAANIRSRLTKAIKNKQKRGSAVRDLGCSIEFFIHYIVGKFIPGMTWENYGRVWHLDHIIPLSSFNLENREEFLKACHYTNYQPLWATTAIARAHGDMISIGNIEKGDKII